MLNRPSIVFVCATLAASAVAAEPTVHRDLVYGDASSRNLMDIFVPEGAENAPLILFVHGGGWLFGGKEVVEDARVGKDRLLDAGFAIASMSYRLIPSPDFPSETPTSRATWPAQLEDMRAALEFVHANADEYGYDADRIALFGESAGGHLVLAAGLDVAGEPERDVEAVVAWYPITDVENIDNDRAELGIPEADLGAASPESYLIGADVEENPELAATASPIHMLDDVGETLAPMLLMHGEIDEIIPYIQSVEFHEKMQAEGYESQLVLLPEGTHAGGSFETDPQTLETVIAFLTEQLPVE